MTRRVSLWSLLLIVPVFTGCTSGESPNPGPSSSGPAPPSPSATESEPTINPVVGTYSVTAETVRSTIESNPVGNGAETEYDVFLTCWDEDCATLAQRGFTADVWLGQTFRLRPRGTDGLKSERVRTGPCGGGIDGNYTESFRVTWQAKDDDLTGLATQKFGGCEGNKAVSATYKLTGERQDGPAPYLGGEEVGAVVEALNAVQPPTSRLNRQYLSCYKPRATAVEVAGCKVKAYDVWLAEGVAAADHVAELPAEGYCGKAIRGVATEPSSAAVKRAVTANRGATRGSTTAPVTKSETTANSALATLYAQLVLVGTMCVPPAGSDDLGKGGVLSYDLNQLIPSLDT